MLKFLIILNLFYIFSAKLINDAWNLAYAGELSFSIALDVTLFLKCERNHIVWNPVFTLIDQIGRRIEISRVYHKFQVS